MGAKQSEERGVVRRRIREPEQLESLVSPVRQDILDSLLSSEGMSVRELAGQLGLRPSALYYHLDELEAVGLVSRGSRARPDGRTEAVFSAPRDRRQIEYLPDDLENRELVVRIVRSILRLADRDFERGFDHPAAAASGPKRNLWGARGKAWLSAEDLRRVNELLAELSAIFDRTSGPEGRTLCALTWVLTPVADRSEGAGVAVREA